MRREAATAPVILMADDDADDRVLAEDAMRESGLGGDLRFVEDGEQLLLYLRQQGRYAADAPAPDLILLDLNMPRKNGMQALREIKGDPALRRIPVVILTTSNADKDIQAAYDLGANSFIRKPVTFDRLVEIVRSLSMYWLGTVELPTGAERA